MPELPELEAVKERLEPLIVGKCITEFKVLKPYVLKNHFDGNLGQERVEEIVRRGKYLVLHMTSYTLYIHLMLHGLIEYLLPSAKIRKSATALLTFDDGTMLEFSEKTTKKRMSIYIKKRDEVLANIDKIGVEPLARDFTADVLARLLKSDRRRLKSFLCRQSKIAGIGNAYADEILWKSGLSPFKMSPDLTAQEVERLHRSIVEVLQWAIDQVKYSMRMDKRNFLRIHGKKGMPCPTCGDTIRVISFTRADTYYCPTCQTGGHKLKDRRMSKFYR